MDHETGICNHHPGGETITSRMSGEIFNHDDELVRSIQEGVLVLSKPFKLVDYVEIFPRWLSRRSFSLVFVNNAELYHWFCMIIGFVDAEIYITKTEVPCNEGTC